MPWSLFWKLTNCCYCWSWSYYWPSSVFNALTLTTRLSDASLAEYSRTEVTVSFIFYESPSFWSFVSKLSSSAEVASWFSTKFRVQARSALYLISNASYWIFMVRWGVYSIEIFGGFVFVLVDTFCKKLCAVPCFSKSVVISFDGFDRESAVLLNLFLVNASLIVALELFIVS